MLQSIPRTASRVANEESVVKAIRDLLEIREVRQPGATKKAYEVGLRAIAHGDFTTFRPSSEDQTAWMVFDSAIRGVTESDDERNYLLGVAVLAIALSVIQPFIERYSLALVKAA